MATKWPLLPLQGKKPALEGLGLGLSLQGKSFYFIVSLISKFYFLSIIIYIFMLQLSL